MPSIATRMCCLAAATALIGAGADVGHAQRPDPAAREDTERARAIHLLNRISYGPRPGDVDRVLAAGIERYLDEQLRPATIIDAEADTYLARLAVLRMSAAELGRVFREQQRARRARQRAQSRGAAADRPARARPTGLRRHLGEFQQAAVARAILSERQLHEVMVDFWTNHFNVFLGKGIDRYLLPSFIEETLRPRAFGRFEDLLVATAQSPAMLFYLDNAQSVATGAEPPRVRRLRRMARADGRRRNPRMDRQRARADSMLRRLEGRLPRGLNENYARELLELHTLGVDGGYTQTDVVHAARILTGWAIDRRPGQIGFVFNAWAHDSGEKHVMGRRFPAGGGMDEGLELLRMLARHPATREHVSRKLCARFVSDAPPEGCVRVAVAAWTRTDGDMREVVRAILTSDAFWDPAYRNAKFKTPLEFVASAVRAVGGVPDTSLALAQVVGRLGQPLFLQPAPTGFPEDEAAWVNTGALLERLTVGLAIAAGRAPGVRLPDVPAVAFAGDVDALVGDVNRTVLQGRAGVHTLGALRRQIAGLGDRTTARVVAIGLALGSPEFQRQ